MYLGVDIGGTAVKYGLVGEDGKVNCLEEFPVDFDGYETPILDTVLKTSKQYLGKHLKNKECLSGIGIAATGQINTYEGIVAGTCGSIKNWDKSRIRDEFIKNFHLPCTVINDANSVALGEMWTGNAKGYSDFAVITVGTGIGGGIVTDGKILQGRMGFGGEIGHMVIAKNGTGCTCGNKGCLEQYASVTALIRRVAGRRPDLAAEKLSGRLIFDMAQNGHQEISAILTEWIEDISTGIISLVHLLNPQLILVGGGVSARQELFIKPLREKVKSGLMPNFSENLQLKAAALGNAAGVIGAVYYLRQQSLFAATQ